MPVYRFLIFDGADSEARGQFHNCADDDEARVHATELMAKRGRRVRVQIWCSKREVAFVIKRADRRRQARTGQ